MQRAQRWIAIIIVASLAGLVAAAVITRVRTTPTTTHRDRRAETIIVIVVGDRVEVPPGTSFTAQELEQLRDALTKDYPSTAIYPGYAGRVPLWKYLCVLEREGENVRIRSATPLPGLSSK